MVVLASVAGVFILVSNSLALTVKTSDSLGDGYTTVLKKNLKNYKTGQKHLIHIKIKTSAENTDYPDSATHILNRHIGLVGYLMINDGWKLEHGINHDDAVDIEVEVVPRNTLRTFAFFFICEKSKTWNQVVERTGMKAFYRDCLKKLKSCLETKHHLK